MDNYSFFLFSKLSDLYIADLKDLEYDVLFEKLSDLYKEYDRSEFNDTYQSEYTCMTNFFKSKANG